CARPAGRVPGRGLDRCTRGVAGRGRPGAQRARAPDLAVPARSPHRRLRRPGEALPRLGGRALPTNGRQWNERSCYCAAMNAITAPTSKGAATREAIVERAYEIARCAGLEGLSIGNIAQAVGMSKSGVFAHFGSREDLQLAVLDLAANRFGEAVLVPALAQPRGLPRLRAVMQHWFDFVHRNDGNCVLLGSVTEYDDRPGAVRDRVLGNEERWREVLARSID